MKRDCYEVLGVPRHADEKAIKRAYRKLAKQYHPDTNAGNPDAQNKFRELGEAYGILSDPEKKEIYDEYGWEAFENGMDPKAYRDARKEWEKQGAWHGFGSGQGQGTYGDWAGSDPGDFFRHFSGGRTASDGDGTTYRTWHFSGDPADAGDLGGMFGDLFGSGFGNYAHHGAYRDMYGGGGPAPEAYDREASVSIGFDEAVFGCTKTIRLDGMSGAGAQAGTVQGNGQTIQVDIPAGIEDGRKLRLRGKGARKPGGGSGDLYLRIRILERPGFTRKGKDIYTEAEIPFVTAALGGEATLPTLNGQVLCRIPAGTQSGSRIRLKGKGVPAGKNGSEAGHEYVTIRISVPRSLSPEEAKALRAFERASQKKAADAGGHARTA